MDERTTRVTELTPMAIWFVYITAKDKSQALAIGHILVEERLAACVNLWDGMTSIYRWEGAIEQASEAVLIAKTQESLVQALTERVKCLHSYDCPCVVAWPVGAGSTVYLDWIAKETG
jgi:periplasmic divalent cation tolerance protein